MVELLREFLRSFTGRLLLGAMVIHAVMMPALFTGILYIAKQEIETQFVQGIRSYAYLLGHHISDDPDKEHVQFELEQALLSGQVVFAKVVHPEYETQVALEGYQAPEAFTEDYGVGENNDAIYHIITPLLSDDGEMLGSMFLAYDETPLQENFATVNQRGIYIALAYFLVTVVLIAILSPRLTAMQRRLLHQSRHDQLTGLPNRLYFTEWLDKAIRRGKRKGNPFAILLLDIKRVKEINDALGYEMGDGVLQQTAKRLLDVTAGAGKVARLGSDEFVVLLDTGTVNDARAFAGKLSASLELPFVSGDHSLHLGSSIGIAVFPEHSLDAQGLLRRADIAMYEAKKTHATSFLFDSNIDQNTLRRLTLSNELRTAIDNDELVVYYQPKLDLRTDRITGAEALVRWNHPTLGFIGPDEFIPIAEQVGLIDALTLCVMEIAIQQCAQWRDQGWQDFSMAVNLSAWNLQDDSLPDKVFEMLDRHRLPATCLQLELTESAIYSDMGQALKILERIDAAGIALAIDDFGTGYSSLTHLRELPLSYFKIDKSFVMDMEHKASDAAIVRASLDLARNLGLVSIAEGVEHESTLKLLKELGCDTVQGYFVQRPVPAAEFEPWYLQRLSAREATTGNNVISVSTKQKLR